MNLNVFGSIDDVSSSIEEWEKILDALAQSEGACINDIFNEEDMWSTVKNGDLTHFGNIYQETLLTYIRLFIEDMNLDIESKFHVSGRETWFYLDFQPIDTKEQFFQYISKVKQENSIAA